MINLILGTMGSGKSKKLIEQATFYKLLGFDVCVYSNSKNVFSRNGNILDSIDYHDRNSFWGNIVFIDECQFLTDEQIDFIINDKKRKYHIFGLVNDFNGMMFDSTKRLIQYSDKIKTLSKKCDICEQNQATHHLLLNKEETLEKDKYKSVCYDCWKDKYMWGDK